MDKKDIELMMILQYNFPLTSTPYADVGEQLGIPEEEVLERIERLSDLGYLKRIGAYVNYRSEGLISALIGAEVGGEVLEPILGELRADDRVTHCYEREHEVYNLWFVVKAGSLEELMKYAEVLRNYGVKNYVIMLSKRTCKLSVRFDLWRGISWSPSQIIPDEVPRLEELGVRRDFVAYVRRLPLNTRPYRRLAERTGLTEEEIVGKIGELIEVGVIRDFGAALDGERLGFKHNAMVLIHVERPFKACKEVALEVPEATHVVVRETVAGSWSYNLYVMLHARERGQVDEALDKVVELVQPSDYVVLYSKRNLKFVVR